MGANSDAEYLNFKTRYVMVHPHLKPKILNRLLTCTYPQFSNKLEYQKDFVFVITKIN